MERISGDDYDFTAEEKLARPLKRRKLDIKEFEISTCRYMLKRSVEDLNADGEKVDPDYLMFLKGLWMDSESSCSNNEGKDGSDDEDDLDPEYMIFMENLREYAQAYILQMATKNGMETVIYEGEDESDDEYENDAERGQIFITDKGGETDNVMDENRLHSKAAKNMSGSPNRGKIGVCSYPNMYNSMTDSTIGNGNNRELNSLRGDIKAEAVKDLNNVPERKATEISRSPSTDVRENVVYTRKDRSEDIRREARNSAEEKESKSKWANNDKAMADGHSSGKPSPKGNHEFGFEFEHELNADGVDECYRTFLKSVKFEGDSFVFAVEGLRPVKHEELDAECSDSEVFVTDNAADLNELGCNPFQFANLVTSNEHRCPVSNGECRFRKKLMAKLGEPYDEREYTLLWKEINERKQKVGYHELRSGAVKSFKKEEYGPSYLDNHPKLKRKIAAVGHSQQAKLYLLRGFFFWIQNLALEEAFQPWSDKSCLESMPKD